MAPWLLALALLALPGSSYAFGRTWSGGFSSKYGLRYLPPSALPPLTRLDSPCADLLLHWTLAQLVRRERDRRARRGADLRRGIGYGRRPDPLLVHRRRGYGRQHRHVLGGRLAGCPVPN